MLSEHLLCAYTIPMRLRLFDFLSDPLKFLHSFHFTDEKFEAQREFSDLAKSVEQGTEGAWHCSTGGQWKGFWLETRRGEFKSIFCCWFLGWPWPNHVTSEVWLPWIEGWYLKMNCGQALKSLWLGIKYSMLQGATTQPHCPHLKNQQMAFPACENWALLPRSVRPANQRRLSSLLHTISSWKSALILSLAQALLWKMYFENELFWAKKSVHLSRFISFTIRLLLLLLCQIKTFFTTISQWARWRALLLSQDSLQKIKNLRVGQVSKNKSEVNKTLGWGGKRYTYHHRTKLTWVTTWHLPRNTDCRKIPKVSAHYHL